MTFIASKTPSEIAELALDDAMIEGVALIEWPERMRSLPDSTLRVRLEVTGETSRRVEISGPERWAKYFVDVGHIERG